MPDPTALQAEIDGLHAKATPGPWNICGYCEVIRKNTGDGVDTYVLSTMRRSDAALIVALVNAWPTLSAALTEMRRKAEALDRISGLLCKHGRSSQSSVDLISAICDTIVEATPDRSGQKETT